MTTILRDRFKNAVEIASEEIASARTIQRRLKEMGLMARTPATSQPENEESSLKLGEK